MSRHAWKIIGSCLAILVIAAYFACIPTTLPARFLTVSELGEAIEQPGVLLLTESITRTQETIYIQLLAINNTGRPIHFAAHSPGIGKLEPMYAKQAAIRHGGILERKLIHCGHGWSRYVMMPGFATRFSVRLTEDDREAKYGFGYRPFFADDSQTKWVGPFRYKDHRTTP